MDIEGSATEEVKPMNNAAAQSSTFKKQLR
jgi:hypothetical protein